MSDWQKAEEHVERASELVRTGKWRDAERELRRATEIDPNRGEWHALLGSSLDALGRPEEALASIRQAAALMPEELAHKLLVCYYRLIPRINISGMMVLVGVKHVTIPC